jgi:NitT/TauT family transport system substrate-binding protein/sulfonate transport system substrate-binding protein
MSTLSRRSLLSLAALGGVAAVTAACGDGKSAAQAGSGEKWTLRVGTIGSKNQLTSPTGYLHAKNELLPLLTSAKVGAIEVYTFPNGPDLNQALVGNQLDIASYGDTPALIARGAGQPTRLISQANVANDAGIVTVKGGVASLRELEGKVIATQTGSYIHRYLLGALADLKVTPKQIVHVYSTDTEAALEKRSVDAAAVPANYALFFQGKGYPLLELASKDRPAYLGTSATVVTETVLKNQPAIVAAWQRAQNEATKRAKANWEDYITFNTGLGAFPRELVARTVLPAQLPDTPFTDAGVALLKGTKDFLVAQKSIKKDFAIDDWIAPGARSI